jgi:hypothetical protein
MSRRWGIVVVALLLSGVVWVALLSSRPDDLSYHGKSLSQWQDQLDDHFFGAANWVGMIALPAKTTEQIEAADAIRALGTNTIPRLLRDLSATDSRVFEGWQQAQQFFREKILRQKGFGRDVVTPAKRTRWKAALALDALGPAAQSAIPQLASMVNKPTSCKQASFILAGMGPAGIAVLTNLPPSSNSWQQMCAVWAIGQHPQTSTNLVPWLLALATNRPPGSVGGVPFEIWALGEIHADAARVIPVLIEKLSNTNGRPPGMEQSYALEALGHYGKEASNAIPVLKAMQASPYFREQPGEVLKKIIAGSP